MCGELRAAVRGECGSSSSGGQEMGEKMAGEKLRTQRSWQVISLPFSMPVGSFSDAEQEGEAEAREPRSPGAVPHCAQGGHLGR